ncbi:hypothetical protein AN964_14020 [Heyndrickxia shackletonii]|uniref:Uncharacterized protein n=1 Tax=Heyndrickxia shackletonii TaxID=157838 RepID=A0A0Q3TLF8_9BACI|nr:hypothetical protein [Heyndrickxia shackletonii]KQL54505.1 hypothetical protein AN964_14020 [Heyndrickxia shackletonii]NEY99234.1 hypothetical protein [Heyndrickxia shackletonii]
MNTLIIYDNTGFVLDIRSGDPQPREPIGVPFLWVDIPEGKRIKTTDGIGVDVSATPHQAILEDIPPTEVDLLSKQIADLQYQLMLNGVL